MRVELGMPARTADMNECENVLLFFFRLNFYVIEENGGLVFDTIGNPIMVNEVLTNFRLFKNLHGN